ncbi:SMC-Scp complex subunit ScpB [Mesorhizobium sp.]|uniref:SMC-Scp complex subunit ScpB n=1 Tax=Mesorhizobium sp. TaxID=1871066 RepID=UPI00120A15C6|nr:SMC-Scp complex subunit ScpB [Mesorhizobium sp.]TIP10588.1 MAG: SMC-Scp complex subunit ScpB [Mesorhizobium sp.]
MTAATRKARTRAGDQDGRGGRPDNHGSNDRRSDDQLFDRELDLLPPEARWREWMGRVEAVIFAAAQPVDRDTLAKVVGRGCSLDLLIEDIRAELAGRPYELVAVAGGWQHRTRKNFADAIRAASGASERSVDLTQSEALVLMTIAYFQPITRAELSSFFGREISRDLIGNLRSAGFIGSGPRSPQPGAPYTFVTTKMFLAHFGFDTLRDLPNMEKLEDAGLLNKAKLLADIPGALAEISDEDGPPALLNDAEKASSALFADD